MKKIITAFTASAALAFAAPAEASMQSAISLIYRGNGAMATATHALQTTGNVSAACPHLKVAADSYASSYVTHQDSRTLSLMNRAHSLYKRYC